MKYLFLLIGGYADSRIRYREVEADLIRTGISLAVQVYLYDDLSVLRELDGVADKVYHDLPQSAYVSHDAVRNVRRHLEGQFQAFLMRPQREQVHGVSETLTKIEAFDQEIQLPGFDL